MSSILRLRKNQQSDRADQYTSKRDQYDGRKMLPEEITGRLTAGSVDFPQPRNKKSGNRKDETSRDHGARIDARCGGHGSH